MRCRSFIYGCILACCLLTEFQSLSYGSPEEQDATPSNAVKEEDRPILSIISSESIFVATNKYRIKHKVGSLRKNNILDAVAKDRAEHMLAHQYFDHNAPDGKDFSWWADKHNYAFDFMAENIAYGPFNDVTELMDLWIKSRPHRINILDSDFTELGVAVIIGEFKGYFVHFAVQIFGTPLSVSRKGRNRHVSHEK